MIKLNFLLHSTFRSNPVFELIEWGNLNRLEQEALAGLLNNPEIFGVFRLKNVDGTTTTKLAYKEVALLFYFLRQPGKLPQYFKATFDDDVNMTLAKLIMEGLFEIESGNQFLSGAAAQSVLYEQQEVYTTPETSLIPHLSAKAIQYALRLKAADTRALASKLYCYNTVPILPQQHNNFNTFEEIEHFLNIGKEDFFSWGIYKNWNRHEPSEKYKWLSWSRKQNGSHVSPVNVTYKIYISPVLASLPEVFVKGVRAITKSKAFSFKTGMDRPGLLRPDKFVVYFHQYDHLMEAAGYLKEALKGFEAQGVPFTAALDTTGMLSWGVDPPGDDVILNIEGGSWRASVTDKIAAAVTQANTEGLSKDKSIEFVMNKISLEGIDPLNWVPTH